MKLWEKLKTLYKPFAVFLSLCLLVQFFSAYAENLYAQEDPVKDTALVEQQVPLDASFSQTEQETSFAKEELYQDGKIRIYNLKQLQAIGSGSAVMTGDTAEESFATGEALYIEDQLLTYALDAQYELMNDIRLDSEQLWMLPENFSGSFSTKEKADTKLYDKESDTIYIYHPYQLKTILDENGKNEPVMSGDKEASAFGIGQILYSDKEKETKLMYSKEHHYVLSASFSEQMPQMTAEKIKEEVTVKAGSKENAEGRDFVGQVVKEIDGKDYILIGNEQQLRAIGHKTGGFLSDGHYIEVTSITFDKDGEVKYKGDADISKGDELADGSVSCGLFASCYGPNEQGEKGEKDTHKTGLRYEPNANYVIFRDIDLQNEAWTPLMFSGTMIGKKNLQDDISIKISNVNVDVTKESGVFDKAVKIPIDQYMGLGFFGTIASGTNFKEGNTGLLSAGQAIVKNLDIENVSITSKANEVKGETEGLLDTLLKPLLDLLLGGGKGNETMFAAGGFAGRIVGEALVENCTVKNISISNVKGMNGGFVGNVEGTTRYDFLLSGVVGGTVDLLVKLLEAIPALGLGSLVDILVDKLGVDRLIPTGYYSPQIKNSMVSGTVNIAEKETNFNGGFAGRQVGSVIKDSSVQVSSLNISGKNFNGGFSGAIVNGEIVGVLQDLGVDLADFATESVIDNCKVEVAEGKGKITSSNEYAGGFSGLFAASYAITSSVKGLQKVEAENYAGGFSGRATIGWGTTLGASFDSSYNDTLLSKIKNLLGAVVEGKPNMDAILSLVGITPSRFYGITIDGDLLEVSASEKYAGGIVGHGEGIELTSYDSAIYNKLRDKIKSVVHDPKESKTANAVKTISKITAGSYAGQAAGKLSTVSAGGLLDTTLSIGQYLPFAAENITITGNKSEVSVTDGFAGGAVGEALGGTLANIELQELSKVSAKNYVGGFIGYSGTGSLLSANSGLDVLGLGLIQVNGLLAVADGVVTNINSSRVLGENLQIVASGDTGNAVEQITAGGFAGYAGSSRIADSTVSGVSSVKAPDTKGYAGGFVGLADTNGLASLTDDASIPQIIDISGLLKAVEYLIPIFDRTSVTFAKSTSTEAQVRGEYAGGFGGDIQSAKINKTKEETEKASTYDGVAVKNLSFVQGKSYAGGFAGRIVAGGLAEAGGLSLLGGLIQTNVGDLLSVLNVYIPEIENASVHSQMDEKGTLLDTAGLCVEASDPKKSYAGGYVGYGSGVQIADSDVKYLAKTKVTPPSDLETNKLMESETYFGKASQYSVKAASYAGGYAGQLNIGDVAAVGSGLSLLGTLEIDSLLSGLEVAPSKITNSDVYGAVGGFNILANGDAQTTAGQKDPTGHAGGYAGAVSGSILQDCNSYNFEYIIGRESAGGHTGLLEPGNVASVLKEDNGLNLLAGLVKISNLAEVLESFVSKIENSQTTAVPCGGIVRAEGLAKGVEGQSDRLRGLAGGYVGYDLGGQIKGTEKKPNAAYRIRSVYGSEYAGGYAGWMKAANVVDTGSLSLLYDTIKASSPISALNAIYPVSEHTAVYGPLRGLDVATWNRWVEVIGSKGAYGNLLKKIEPQENQAALDEFIKEYAYGYHSVAGRMEYDSREGAGGVAGGYVGRMEGGDISSSVAQDVKKVSAMRSSGGFAGEMITGTVADAGSVELGKLSIIKGVGLLQTFVPVINSSSAIGYQSGASIEASGNPKKENGYQKVGYAGGYVGHMVGGQLNVKREVIDYDEIPDSKDEEKEGEAAETKQADAPEAVYVPCAIENLRRVDGKSYVGGYAGQIESGSALNLNLEEAGLLNKILKYVINTDDLASVLNATVSTVQAAEAKAWDSDYGFVVNGAYSTTDSKGRTAAATSYAKAVGGFAGEINGAVLGKKEDENLYTKVQGVREVIGGKHAGGYVGLADVSAAVSLSSEDKKTSILDLIGLGASDVADIFRTYIYHADICGSISNGLKVSANEGGVTGNPGMEDEKVYLGNAGGFAGSFYDATAENATVSEIHTIKGINNSGGFVGHAGKSALIDIDEASVGNASNPFHLLNGAVGVLDVFGSTMKACTAEGIEQGMVIKSQGGEMPIAGGFVGLGDLSRITYSHVKALKQVASDAVAGGFAGKTSFAYLASVKLDSTLVNLISKILGGILENLYVDELQNLLNGVSLGFKGVLRVELLKDNRTVLVDLLGLKITASLVENDKTTAKVTIGDSEIILKRGTDGTWQPEGGAGLAINLIKANRTRIADSTVTGIKEGYDVFGGKANNESDGTVENSAAGGFVGYNKEGLLEENDMYYADTIRGYADKVGTFTGVSDLSTSYDDDTIYDYNQKRSVEGNNNTYRIYRNTEQTYDTISTKPKAEHETETNWKNVFVVKNLKDYTDSDISGTSQKEDFDQLKGAMMQGESDSSALLAYISSAHAVLMDGTPTYDNEDSDMTEPPEMQDPCDEQINFQINKIWKDHHASDRPESITVTLHRTYTKEDGTTVDEIVGGYEAIELTSPAKDPDSDVWKKIIKGLPAYVEIDGKKYYYTYYVTENQDVVPDYTIEIDNPDKDGTGKKQYVSTITNSKSWMDLLPDTGGMGTAILMLTGMALLGFGVMLPRRKKKRRTHA